MIQDPNFKSASTAAPASTPASATGAPYEAPATKSSAVWGGQIVLALAVACAFGASLYQSSQLSHELGTVKRQLLQSNQQITDMQGQLTSSAADAKREASESAARMNEQLEKTRKEAQINSQRAVQTVSRQQGKVLTALEAKNTELSDQLDQFKKDNSAKSTEVDQALTGIKGDVGDVKTEVASTKADLDNTKTDLRRAMGDMGVMSGLIATNATELAELRKLGEKNYVEFTLPKNGSPQKVGDVQMALKKADVKRSRFTLDLLADDKKVEKRDKTINEPVQFYTAQTRLPYEVVVNTVTKDSVKGYLAIPKVKLAQR